MNHAKFILDFEGLVGRDNEYVVKELSIIGNVEPYRFGKTVLLMQPYAWDQLPAKNQRTNRWLMFQRHGIKWTDGSVPYENLYSIVQGLHGDIFIKGLEKAEFIASLVSRSVYELGALGCPKVEELRVANMCPVRHHRGPTICSEYKCRAYAMWFEEHLPAISLEASYDAKVGSFQHSPPEPLRATDCYKYVDAPSGWED